ncbi:putative esterase [Luteibacter rhizovicinus]|uniref:Putative esterase n=1 Tax=Luteibacter rhizovicinus TaxID=242606 RepID=A0A4R3YWR4_9GAMM|nr:alpha/beta hydrolase-fold protein [Luteibacter rhizovicinus]TCV95864.1 putative esterase [Luteibacter rhizovicinus]
MQLPFRAALAAVCLLAASLQNSVAKDADANHAFVRVSLSSGVSGNGGGRLLIFAMPVDGSHEPGRAVKLPDAVDINPIKPMTVKTFVAAREVGAMDARSSIDVDLDAMAWPQAFSTLPHGAYAFQAVLDVDRDYAYAGRKAPDLLSEVTLVQVGSGSIPSLRLSQAIPSHDPWLFPAGAPEWLRAAEPEARANVTEVNFASPALSAFWGRRIEMRAMVLVPPGYKEGSSERYPTIYLTHGYGATVADYPDAVASIWARMKRGEIPPMIWVLLEESSPTGTHEFADSVNNGPWGSALTTEFIPHLESTFRMDGKASGRFLTGHSSGGWAALWVQTHYPSMFGGAWATSPDPTDFHDFSGVDLYGKQANFYKRSDGSEAPLVRERGEVIWTVRDFARLERVLGEFGGQMASYEWVFSPKGIDGRPQQLFDRDTGAIDPKVLAYWSEHYDIVRYLQRDWPRLKDQLRGKVHVIVGTEDTFYLDGPAHRLKAVLDELSDGGDVRFKAGRGHFDLYKEGEDRVALRSQIAREMYAVARPSFVAPKGVGATAGK